MSPKEAFSLPMGRYRLPAQSEAHRAECLTSDEPSIAAAIGVAMNVQLVAEIEIGHPIRARHWHSPHAAMPLSAWTRELCAASQSASMIKESSENCTPPIDWESAKLQQLT